MINLITAGKVYFVSWETDTTPELDNCALQGPHTLEDAKRIRDEMHRMGLKASVIDVHATLMNVYRSGQADAVQS